MDDVVDAMFVEEVVDADDMDDGLSLGLVLWILAGVVVVPAARAAASLMLCRTSQCWQSCG